MSRLKKNQKLLLLLFNLYSFYLFSTNKPNEVGCLRILMGGKCDLRRSILLFKIIFLVQDFREGLEEIKIKKIMDFAKYSHQFENGSSNNPQNRKITKNSKIILKIINPDYCGKN